MVMANNNIVDRIRALRGGATATATPGMATEGGFRAFDRGQIGDIMAQRRRQLAQAFQQRQQQMQGGNMNAVRPGILDRVRAANATNARFGPQVGGDPSQMIPQQQSNAPTDIMALSRWAAGNTALPAGGVPIADRAAMLNGNIRGTQFTGQSVNDPSVIAALNAGANRVV